MCILIPYIAISKQAHSFTFFLQLNTKILSAAQVEYVSALNSTSTLIKYKGVATLLAL